MHFKMQIRFRVVVFFFLLNLFVWPEISLFNLLQALWTGSLFFLIFLFKFSFLLWVMVCSPFCGLGPCLTYTFLILGHRVVSIMCEKCLLYSFKKFPAEYKTIYKYLSTYSGGVLSVCWVAPSDSFSFGLRIPQGGILFLPVGESETEQP